MLALTIAVLSTSCSDQRLLERKATLKSFRAYSETLIASMRASTLSDDLPSFESTSGKAAPYSWRLVIVLRFIPWESGVLLDPNYTWDSEYYSEVDQEFANGLYGVPDDKSAAPKCGVFAVTGEDTAFESLQSGNEANARGDSILLMDADLGDVHWMSPVDIDGPSVRQSPRAMPRPATASGRYVAFLDGVVMLLRSDVPSELLAKYFSASSVTSRDREKDLGPYVVDRLRSELPPRPDLVAP